MSKNIFKEKIIRASSKKLEEIGKAVSLSESSFKKLLNAKSLFLFSLLFSLFALGVTGLSFDLLPEKIPLFYTRPWGKEQLAQKQLLFLIPCLTLISSLLNFSLVSFLLKKNNDILSIVLCFFSFFFSLIGLIGVVKIVLLMI